MIKLSWAYDTASLKKHLSYIAGTGYYKKKAEQENITRDNRISTSANQKEWLGEYQEALAPDLSKKQRTSKRKALKIIISWVDCDKEKQNRFLMLFMSKHFSKHKYTWARHEKPTKDGVLSSHFHLVICPRDKAGTVQKFGPREIRQMQSSYLEMSKSLGLKTGWDTSNLKKRTTAPKPSRKRRRRRKRKGLHPLIDVDVSKTLGIASPNPSISTDI